MTKLLRNLFGVVGSQKVDHTLVKFIIYPLTMIALLKKQNWTSVNSKNTALYINGKNIYFDAVYKVLALPLISETFLRTS